MFSPSPTGSTIGSSYADALLEHRHPLVEPVGVLVARLDVLHLAARELLVEQVASSVSGSSARRPAVDLAAAADLGGGEELGARPRPASPFRARRARSATVGVGDRRTRSPPRRSQKPRNSAAQRGESFIDSAYIACSGSIKSLREHPLALARSHHSRRTERSRRAAQLARARGRRRLVGSSDAVHRLGEARQQVLVAHVLGTASAGRSSGSPRPEPPCITDR